VLRVCAALLLITATRTHAQDAAALRPDARAWERLTAAEDARAATTAQAQTMLSALRSDNAALRQVAVRGLGRIEAFDLAERIIPLLQDPSAAVRAEAAHGLGQSVVQGEAAAARAALEAALHDERDPAVIGAIAETLGRLRQGDAQIARATVAEISAHLNGEPAAVLGALRGLYLLARQPAARNAVTAAASAVSPLVTHGSNDTTSQRIRRLAVMVLVATAAHDADIITVALNDADGIVRREAAAGLNTLSDTAAVRRRLHERLHADSPEPVR
jgi:hypothetical protein